MGAFLLCKKVNKTEDIERGLLAFKEKGFEAPSEFQLGDYRLFSFQKQLVPGQKNTRYDGRAVLVSVGTPVYKQKSYADTLDAVFEDLKTGQFEYARMYGSFVLLFYDGNQIRFVLDDMRQLPIYSSCDGDVISTSFLACAKAFSGSLTIDKMACLEKLCTGMITGTDTLFMEITRSIPESLQSVVSITANSDILNPSRNGESLRREAQKQIECLNSELDEIKPLVDEYGGDMGLSGGYDSRLLYGLLQHKYGDNLSVHTHCTKGSHEKEIKIATQLADMYHKKLNVCPTVPLQSVDGAEAEETLKNNVYLFDGYSDSHYGTFSSTYTKNYRKAVNGGRLVFFTGVSGEIYRNYRKISKPVLSKRYFDTYVFYCHYQNAIKDRDLGVSLRQYVMGKAFHEMGKEQNHIMTPKDVRRYNACVRLPYKASCASSAFNQLSFYDAPCAHRVAIQESMAADRVVGDDSRLEAEMILLVDNGFKEVPVAKVDTSSIGKANFTTAVKRFVYARLPMSVIRKRKIKNTKTSLGEQIVKKSQKMQEAVDFSKGLIGEDASVDCLIGNNNSCQNTIFLCSTLYEFRDQIKQNK